jgi:hypothetical protein
VVRTADRLRRHRPHRRRARQDLRRTGGELDALIRKASEAVYESTQPEGYAAWLRGKGRTDEAAAVHERLTISGSRERRAWAFAEWAGFGKTPPNRSSAPNAPSRWTPELPLAHRVLASAHASLGHDEAAFQARRRAVELLEGRRAEEMAPWAAVLQLKETRADIASALGRPQPGGRPLRLRRGAHP